MSDQPDPWLTHHVRYLEERCKALEKENFELKKAIMGACTQLKDINVKEKQMLSDNDGAYKPRFKKAQWEKI